MILPKEINAHAAKNKISDRQVEKDYVLSWALNGISNHAFLKDGLAFKGGTALKKCYFEDYRYSEDLDFTLLDEKLSHDALKKRLQEVFEWVKEESNITFRHRHDEIHKSTGNALFYADYAGPLQGALGSRDIKIDVTRGEKIEFPLESHGVFPVYSDMKEFPILCYSLNEALIEKMVALMGRLEPRDLYDFWYLTEIGGMDAAENRHEFESKAIHKQAKPVEFAAKVIGKEAVFKRDWQTKLENQIHDLPDFDKVMRSVKRQLRPFNKK